MAVHKKKEIKPPADAKAMAGKEGKPTEPVVVSDIVTETTERVEVIEEVAPKAAKSEAPAESSSSKDPLTDFKEKMNEEEKSVLDESQKKNYLWPILFIFIITMLLLLGVFLYKQGTNTNDKIKVVTLTPTPAIAPEPTKTINLTKYEIEIQNGSEVAGEAGRQQASLEEEGFKISAIGNANNSDYTDTIIKAKKEVEKAFLDKLKSVLEKTFTVGEIRTLADSSQSWVVVILGTKK